LIVSLVIQPCINERLGKVPAGKGKGPSMVV
jgi:hypothetical protein